MGGNDGRAAAIRWQDAFKRVYDSLGVWWHVLMDDEFVSSNNLNQLETISKSELRDSFSNVFKTKMVLLPKLSFGESSFSNIPIGFFGDAIGQDCGP